MEVPELPELADAVLEIVDRVPPGKVVTYGDIGKVVGAGPRQVGAVMSQYGGMVTWWRVLRADGRPPSCHEGAALEHYREEDTPLKGTFLDRVDLARARFDLSGLDFRRPGGTPDGTEHPQGGTAGDTPDDPTAAH